MSLSRLIAILSVFLLIGCSKNEKITAKKVGDLIFRRTYINLVDLSEIEKDTAKGNRFADSVVTEDPYLVSAVSDSDIILKNKLIQAGLVKDEKLLLSKFYSIAKDTINMAWKNNQTISITQEYDTILHDHVLKLKNADQVEKLLLEANNWVHFTQLNLFKGKYKEIVVLYNWYIMNGDNYEIMVYSVE